MRSAPWRPQTPPAPSWTTSLAAPDTLPLIVDLASRGNAPQLQFAAIGALNSVAWSAVEAHRRACAAAVPPAPLVRLLGHEDSRVTELAAGTLAGLTGEAHEARNAALSAGALEPLLTQLGRSTPQAPARAATVAVHALCFSTPAPPFSSVAPALPALAALVRRTSVWWRTL